VRYNPLCHIPLVIRFWGEMVALERQKGEILNDPKQC
jgi:hypothetical protein